MNVYKNPRMTTKAEAHYNRMVLWAIARAAALATLRSPWSAL